MQTPPPSIARDQAKVDANHLKLLAIFHFVAAGLSLLGMAFVLAHYTFMHFFLTNPAFNNGPRHEALPAELLGILKFFYLAAGLWFFASLILNLISGLCLLTRKGRTFSLVVAVFNCLHLPIGTVLGVFTLIVLIRDSVRELYESAAGGQRN